MQGATANLTVVCTVTNVQVNQAGTWATVELAEAPSVNESSHGTDKELAPLRASLKIPQGVNPPSEGSLLDIRSAILNRPISEYKGKNTPFWTITVFQWRELGTAVNGQKPSTEKAVATKPTVNRPVLDDTSDNGWANDDVPF